jgi:hypothetical protein
VIVHVFVFCCVFCVVFVVVNNFVRFVFVSYVITVSAESVVSSSLALLLLLLLCVSVDWY